MRNIRFLAVVSYENPNLHDKSLDIYWFHSIEGP